MKGRILKLFVFFGLVFAFVFISVNVFASTITMQDGAQIRTTGNQGLKFSASVDSLDGTLEHGFYVAIGKHTVEEISEAIKSEAKEIDGNVLKKVEVEGDNTSFRVVIYNIGEAYFEQSITAVAYVVTEEETVLSETAVTRSIGEVARGLYNDDNEIGDFIANIAKKGAIKVDGLNKTKYYQSLSEVQFEDGDTITLPKGTYSDNFTIDANNVTIQGPNAEKAGTANDREEEAVLTGVVSLNGNGATLKGLKFEGSAQISSANTLDNITISNNYFTSKITGTNLFMLNRTSDYYDNLCIVNNYFEYDEETIENSPSNLLYLSNVRNISFTNNTFNCVKENALFIHDGAGFGLYGNNNVITNNKFQNVGGKAIYVNYYSSIANTTDAILNIESNIFEDVYCGIYLADCENAVKYDEMNITNNTFRGNLSSGIEIHGLPGGIGYLNIEHFNLIENNFETVPEVSYFNLALTGATGNKFDGLINVQNNYYGETGVPAAYGTKFINVKMFEYDYVVNPSYTNNGARVNFNNVEYVIGETAFATISDALNNISDGKSIYVCAGTYAEDLIINNSNVSIVGPNNEISGSSVNREEEAIITGKITITSRLAGYQFIGLKFTGNAQIVATEVERSYIDQFVFKNNLVETSLTSGNFIDLNNTTSYGTGKYANTYSEFTIIDNNKIVGNLNNNSSLIAMGDCSWFTFTNNVITNIGGNVLYFNDSQRGLANGANINNNTFDNVKGIAILVNYWGNTDLYSGSDETIFNICNNTFTNITGLNISIGGSNNDTKISAFTITGNQFSSTVANSLSIKDGSITETKVTTITIQAE